MWNIYWRESETIYRSCVVGVVEDNKVFVYENHCPWSADDRVETWDIRWTNNSEHDIHIWSSMLWSIDDQSMKQSHCSVRWSICDQQQSAARSHRTTNSRNLVVTSRCGGKYLLAVCTNNEYSIRCYRMGISCFRIKVNNVLSFTVCGR